MRGRAPADAGAGLLRAAILVLLAAGPLLFGAVHEPVFIPLLLGCGLVGLAAFFRTRRSEREGRARAPLPGRGLLLSLHGLLAFQLVPMPPGVLRALSPGSYSFYNDPLLLPPLTAWKPISVSPPDTLRGLAFLAAFSLLYLAVFREMGAHPWRRRLMRAVVGTGVAITVVALLQAVSPEPRKVYGLWRPQWDWAVFGPYVNRSHFSGYLVMAAPLGIGFALEALLRLRRAWGNRPRGWLVLGDAEGAVAVRWAAVAVVLVAGLLAAQSRGAVSAFALAALSLPLVSRRRRRTALVVVVVVGLGIAWIGLGGVVGGFEARGIRASRLNLWADMLPIVPRFPVFGVGWNAFSTAYPWYQTVLKDLWVGEAHNDYLQVLLDGGLLGLSIVLCLLALVFRAALARASRDPLDLGLFGALLGLAFHEVVDFNGQIPANAATWVALAALALAGGRGSGPPAERLG